MGPARLNIGILDYARRGTLFIQGDTIYIPHPGSTTQLRRFSSLTAWLKAAVNQITTDTELVRARDYASRVGQFAFCLGRLIPFLRFLDGNDEDITQQEPELQSALADLVRRAELLRQPSAHQTTNLISMHDLQRIFRAPCALTIGLVIPLDPVQSTLTAEPHDIFINGVRYWPCTDRSLTLSSVMDQILEAIQERQGGETLGNDGYINAASAFLQNMENLVSRFELDNAGRYRIIFQSQNFQLHYNRGYFVLVHGPLVQRGTHQRFYIGINIGGSMRQQWLSTPPCVCKHPQDFWMPEGLPQPGNICMGSKGQFNRLLTPSLTDEQALLEWLDAGRVISTGISAFFDRWRQGKLRRPRQSSTAVRR